MKLFGRFLVQRGFATPSDVLKALDLQKDKRVSIGRLSIQHGRLTPRQVLDVLNRQAAGDTRQFGQLAVYLGYLKQTDVETLLVEQRKSVKALGETLLEMKVLDQESLDKALEEYALISNEKFDDLEL